MPKTLRGSFDQALRPLPSVVKGVQACRLPGLKPVSKMPKALRGSFDQALRPLPSVVKGVQACRLPGLKCLKRSAAASTRHSGHSPLLLSLPFARPQTRKMPKALRGSFDQALRPLPSVVKGVQACRLQGLKCLKRKRKQLRPGTQATALCC